MYFGSEISTLMDRRSVFVFVFFRTTVSTSLFYDIKQGRVKALNKIKALLLLGRTTASYGKNKLAAMMREGGIHPPVGGGR